MQGDVVEQFGKYKLDRRIGSGGMAEVFLARTTVAQGLEKSLVIKKIHPALARSRQFLTMFVDEARIALTLNHPNIVQVFDFGQVGQTYFLAMEYVEGHDLLRLLQDAGRTRSPVPLGLCAYVVQQVAKGLDYAHRKTDAYGDSLGIVHRDVSPQNVLVSWDGAVKIVDFGIARARNVNEEEGVVKGKFAYMAPEQARGEIVDRRADVFSAGVLLFELCCGRPLYSGKGKDVLLLARAGAVPRPRDLNRDIPEELEATILKAVAYDPEQRFQTARDLQNALGRFQFQWAHDHSGLVDSGSLAQFIAQLGPSRIRVDKSPDTAPGSVWAREKQERPRPSGTDAITPDPDEAKTQPPATRVFDARQRKPVFVLSALIRGVEPLVTRIGEREASRVVEEFLGVVRDVAYKLHATVHAVHDAGFELIIGLPITSENDPDQAIRLALALIEALDGIGHDVEPELRLAVGVQRGSAIVTREQGGRFSYQLGSTTTTIAGRLAEVAAGAEVLVGGAVYQVARDNWNFEQLRSLELEQDSDTDSTGVTAARIYRVQGPKDRAQRLRERRSDVELIGRDLEVKTLRDAYRQCVMHAAHRLIVLTGETGVGKRAVVNKFLRALPEDEALVLRTTGRAATSLTPYGIVADIARDLLGLADGAEPAEIKRRVSATLSGLYPDEGASDERQRMEAAANLLLGVRSETEPRLEPSEANARIIDLFQSFESRFRSDKPLVLVGEDVHWADSESIKLCEDLLNVPNTRGLFFLFTARPEPKIVKLAGEARADIVRLDELSAAKSKELIRRRFVPDADIDELAKKLLVRTGGNPFFIHEMVDALVERGILTAEPAGSKYAGLLRWTDRDAPIQVPTTIEALIATRVDQLPDRLKETLLRGSVMGLRFTPQDLEPLLSRSVDADLDELVERGFLARDGAAFVFRSDLTTAVTYRMIPDEDRAALHRSAASRMAAASGFRPGRDDAIVARHLELAGDAAAAADRYLKGAAHAIQVGGTSDAFRQLTRCLRLLAPEEHDKRFTAHAMREEVLARLAKWPARLRDIQAMRTEAEALGDSSRLSRAHATLAEYYLQQGKVQAASRSVAPALQYARDAHDHRAECEALRLRAAVATQGGNSDEALRLCDSALTLLGKDRPDLEMRARVLGNRGTALWNMDRLQEAIEAYAEGLVIYRALGLPRLEAKMLNNMGVVFSSIGEPEEALAHYKSALKIDQTLGDKVQIGLKLGNIGQTYMELGDYVRGERYLTKALAMSETHDDVKAQIDVLNSLGQNSLFRGDHQDARERFQRARELATQTDNRYQLIRSLVYDSVAISESEGDTAEAMAAADEAIELSRAMPMPVGEMWGLAARALALLGAGDSEAALQASRAATAALTRAQQAEGREQIWHVHARVCEACGDPAGARAALDQSAREIDKNAARLSDPELRRTYLSGPRSRAIACDIKRLGGSPPSWSVT